MRTFKLMRQNRKLASLALVFCILVQILSPLSAILEQRLIDYIIGSDLEGFTRCLGYAAALVVLTAAIQYLYALAVNSFKAKCTEKLREDLFGSIMKRSFQRFFSHDTAEYISMIENDVNSVTHNFTAPIWALIGAAFSAVAALAVMAVYSPLLTAAAVLCSAVSFCMPVLITKRLRKLIVEKSQREAALSVQLKEALNGHEVIDAFDVFLPAHKRFSAVNRSLTDCLFKLEKHISLLENSSAIVGKAVKCITYSLAGLMAIRGSISVGTVLLFVSLYEYFNADVMIFSQIVPLLKSSVPVFDKLMSVAEEEDAAFAGEQTPTFERNLCVSNLSFQYTADVLVLKNLHMTIRKGEKVALIGSSGCGKSTLIKLLSGRYSEYDGQIFYDGAELRDCDNRRLKRLVTVIHQHTYIFNDTIRYNICLGEDFSEDVLKNAVKQSGVDLFLPAINGGLDGNCGEDGENLSGGQKQRIALARALIRGTKFLILDESVSAMDVETANKIEQDLLDMEDLTLLTITHRIKDGLIHRYDRVLSMSNGQVHAFSTAK